MTIVETFIRLRDDIRAWVVNNLNTKENISNKTTKINADSTDDQYPSAKAVWDVTKNLDGVVSSVNGQTGEVNLTINDIDNRLTIDDISFQYNDSNGSFKAGYEGVFANGDVNGGYNFSVDCFGLNYSGSPSADHDIVLNQIKWIDENDSSLGTFETTHKLSEKANSKDVYTKDEVDSLIASSGGESVLPSSIIINSSTPGSTKQFKITIDDNGTLTATELEGNE